MNLRNLLLAYACLFCIGNDVTAQDKRNNQFGNVRIADFSPKSAVIDSGADAVVLSDIGSSEFEGNAKGYFTLIYKIHKRILLIHRNAFQSGTINALLYTGLAAYAESFDDLEAATYNIEGGQVIQTKLKKDALFKEKINSEVTNYKFALPDLKEGCVVEYKFTIRSPFYNTNIRPWDFQESYPVLWSEYKVTIPPLFNYNVTKQGFLPYAIDSSGTTFTNYSIVDSRNNSIHNTHYSISGDARWAVWALKDVPALRNEMFLSSNKNYVAGVKFQLLSIQYGNVFTQSVVKNWFALADDLLKDPRFGKSLTEKIRGYDGDRKMIIQEFEGVGEAKKIFEYVRDHFSCTADNATYLSVPLDKTYQLKKGTVADINLLLTALLINEGFDAHPVLVSTRENGRASEWNGVVSQFNYVISCVEIAGIIYLLDASVNRLGFGKLPQKCYNGGARLISNPPNLIPLPADSITEEKNTLLFFVNDGKQGISGSIVDKLGYYQSLAMREKIAKVQQDNFIKELIRQYPPEIEVTGMTIDSLTDYGEPLTISNDLKLKFNEDIIYFNPLIGERWLNNPFAAADRLYPVEMPARINQIYILNMEIPDGYEVDEMPKSVKIQLNGSDALFEYITDKSQSAIDFRCRLVINRTNFMPGDYQTLRNFFSIVVKKEAEQIVFKKKR